MENDEMESIYPDPGSRNQSSSPESSNNTVYGQNTQNVQSSLTSTDTADLTRKNRFHLPSAAKGLLGTIQLAVGAILLAVGINTFVFQSYEVIGDSMSPTLHNGDRLIISKIGKSWASVTNGDYIPERGDIIVFKSPSGQDRQLIKRVIGLPGEKVIVKNGNILVINDNNPDGFDPDIDYKDTLPSDTSNEITTDVPEGYLFVSGDNRIGGSSLDSRNELGNVPIDKVVGELKLRILPLNDAEAF